MRNFADDKETLNGILAAAMGGDHEEATGDGDVFHKEDGMQTLCFDRIIPEGIDDKGHR